MIRFSDQIFWQPTRISTDFDNNLYVFALSTTSIVCFTILIGFHLFYVIMAEKNHAIGRHALHRGFARLGATLVAFATASLAPLDVALFVAGHHANDLKAIFKKKILYPVILPAVNQATGIYTTTYGHMIESPNVAKSYFRKLLKDDKRLQQNSTICCGILIVTAILSSLYLQLSFSGLISQGDLRHVYRTYLICISILSCLTYAFYLHHTTFVPGYVLNHLRQTAGTYWDRLVLMADLDSSSFPGFETSKGDILLHLGEDMPD